MPDGHIVCLKHTLPSLVPGLGGVPILVTCGRYRVYEYARGTWRTPSGADPYTALPRTAGLMRYSTPTTNYFLLRLTLRAYNPLLIVLYSMPSLVGPMQLQSA